MCASCGCGAADDRHGDDRNITWSQVVEAAEAGDLSPGQVAQNIRETANVKAMTDPPDTSRL